MAIESVVDAPAKLTLSLRITGIRDDGMHLIDAEMVTLDLADRLTFRAGDGLRIIGPDAVGEDAVGPDAVPVDDTNLVRRALALAGMSADVTVEKRIPAGAGLGGGSADAAAALRWAGFTDVEAAATIGADVAFCLVGGRARVRGVGEVVEPLPFVPRTFTLLTPPVHCSTPAVYRRWDEMGAPEGDHGNDLEPAALSVAPELAQWRDRLAVHSGQSPRLAGSGSTWFVEGAFAGDGYVVARTAPA